MCVSLPDALLQSVQRPDISSISESTLNQLRYQRVQMAQNWCQRRVTTVPQQYTHADFDFLCFFSSLFSIFCFVLFLFLFFLFFLFFFCFFFFFPFSIFQRFDYLCFFSSLFSIFCFVLFLFFPFFLFFFCFFFFCPFFQSSEQTPKPAKNRPEVPIVERAIFFSEIWIFGPRWTRG